MKSMLVLTMTVAPVFTMTAAPVLTMTVAPISTDMASLFERTTRLQSVTSRSQKSLGPALSATAPRPPASGAVYNVEHCRKPIRLRSCSRTLREGDKSALDRLVPLLYPELRKLARGYLRNERPGHTLQPTALVHEAYARLVRQNHPDYRSRNHFMAVAAQIMRQILVDHARARDAGKRGGGATAKVSFDQALGVAADRPSLMIAIDDALSELARKDSVKSNLIEMRFFGGMTAEDSAEVLDMPVTEVRRHLRVAQAWLQRELAPRSGTEPNV
jgi:RNA polymerase sigma factor (TIGR02999 family)